MICLNCGRPNPTGTSLCDRCRERRPGLERARGGVIYQRTRETARLGRRGPGIIVAAVLGLAALIFAGGTFAVFLAPKAPASSFPGVAFDPSASPGPGTFVLGTPSAITDPSATPWFPDASATLDLFTLPPTLDASLAPGTMSVPVDTPRPTRTPGASRTPRPPTDPPPSTQPTPQPPKAKFSWSQRGDTKKIDVSNNSTGTGLSYLWTFSWDPGTFDKADPSPVELPNYDTDYTVTLTVTDSLGRTDTKSDTVRVASPPPPTAEPTQEVTNPPESTNPALN